MQKIALVGNPNTGKTTLFNSLTNLSEHVGNWHGVTVDNKEYSFLFNGEKLTIVDLPGTYSLNSFSFEEEVTQKYLLLNNTIVFNIVDGNNLKRNLYLTFDLLEKGINPILIINYKNELQKNGIAIYTKKLEEELKIKVFLINAKNKRETQKMLVDAIEYIKHNKSTQRAYKSYLKIVNLYKNELSKIIPQKNLENLSQKYFVKPNYLLKCVLENNTLIINELNLDESALLNLQSFIKNHDTLSVFSQNKYKLIEDTCAICVKNENKTIYGLSRLDKILLNKYLSIPIFLCIIALIFYFIFMGPGKFISELFTLLVNTVFFSRILALFKNITVNEFVINLIAEGLIGGALSVLSFLPQVVMLTSALNILEQTGYMSRLAFCTEDIFEKIGLSGKSVFALLMGFGCSTSATLSARTLEDKNSKIKTAMLTPYISCAAKLPLYLVVCGAYFNKYNFLIIFLIYLLGVLIAIIVSFILEKTLLPSKTNNFILEFPPIRKPSFILISKLALKDAKNFLIRVMSVIVSFSCMIWICQNCTFTLKYITNNNGESILNVLGKLFAFIFKPLGLNSAGIVSALICGIVAKEIIVSSLKIINSSENIVDTQGLSKSLTYVQSAIYLSPAASLSFLVFSSLYLPCISTMAVLKKEIGTKWTIFACLLEFVIAYILAFIVYRISLCYFNFGIISCLISLLAFTIFLLSILFVVKFFKKKNKCKYCINAKSCTHKC